MEPTNKQLLQSLHQTIKEQVVAADNESQRSINLSLLAIEELQRREDESDSFASQFNLRLTKLANKGQHLVEQSQAQTNTFDWPKRPPALVPASSDAQQIEDHWEQLSDQIATLWTLKDNPGSGKKIQDFIKDVALLEIEQKCRNAANSPVVDKSESTVERLKQLDSYFQAKIGASDQFKIVETAQLSGGFSNETIKLVASDGKHQQTMVVRLSKSNGIQWPYVATLEEELALLQFAIESGVPSPKPLWLETDASILGGPFMVVEYLAGRMVGDTLQATGTLSNILVRNYAGALARLHLAPWQAWIGRLPQRIVPTANLTVSDSVSLILQRLRGYLDASCITPSPVTVILFQWLETNIPEDTSTPVLTHGDLGFHNWLFDGDTPLALLDWETVALCSPVKDLANVRDVVIPPEQWDIFMEAYIRSGGSPFDEHELHYYAILRQVHAIICTSVALEKMFTYTDPLNISYLELGIKGRAYFYSEFNKVLTGLLQEK